MNKLETNALRIIEFLYPDIDINGIEKYKEFFSSYQGLMPIVFESNNTDYEIHLYSSCVQLNTDDILIFDYNTELEFIEAIQLACIKYLELKNENYYDKLRALLEGLEIEHIEDLLARGIPNTYRQIGAMIAKQNKILQKQLELKNDN